MEEKQYKNFSATIDNNILYPYLRNVNNLITEASFIFSNEGLKIIEMDAANVSMVILNIPSNKFIEYHINEPFKIGLNIKNLCTILKDNKKAMLKISMDSNKLYIDVIDKIKTRFETPILDLDENKTKIPELEFKGFISGCNAKELYKLIVNLAKIGESLIISIKDDDAVFLCSGDLNSSTSIKELCTNIKGNGSSKYSIKYLLNILKFYPEESLKICLSNDYLLMIEGAFIKHILAPRVDYDRPETEEACIEEA